MREINESDFTKHRDDLIQDIKSLVELLTHERKALERLTVESFPKAYIDEAISRREENIKKLLEDLKKSLEEWKIFYAENCK